MPRLLSCSVATCPSGRLVTEPFRVCTVVWLLGVAAFPVPVPNVFPVPVVCAAVPAPVVCVAVPAPVACVAVPAPVVCVAVPVPVVCVAVPPVVVWLVVVVA